MTNFDSVDYFTDQSLIPNPHPYFDHLRARNPTACPINNGVLAVTGWESANAVYKDVDSFSSCVAVAGPFTPIPFVPEGDDICAQLEEHRTEIPMFEHMVTMDPPNHTDARSLLSRLLTPKRLKENEDFMWRLADRHIDEFVAGANDSDSRTPEYAHRGSAGESQQCQLSRAQNFARCDEFIASAKVLSRRENTIPRGHRRKDAY